MAVEPTTQRICAFLQPSLNKGVATKYLQNYLNWFRLKEKYRDIDYMKRAMEFSLSNLTARAGYLTFIKKIRVNYQTTTF